MIQTCPFTMAQRITMGTRCSTWGMFQGIFQIYLHLYCFLIVFLILSLPCLGSRLQFAVNAGPSYWRQFGSIYLDFDSIELLFTTSRMYYFGCKNHYYCLSPTYPNLAQGHTPPSLRTAQLGLPLGSPGK